MRNSAALAAIAVIAIPLILGCGAGKEPAPETPSPTKADADTDDGAEEGDVSPHASVTAFILAKCPYAVEAMRALIALKREMGDALAIRIGFMGLVDAEGNIDSSIGDAEIAAARAHVCVAQASDDAEWIAYLGCVYEGDNWRAMPAALQTCVGTAKIDMGEVRKCLDSGDGDWILAKTYAATTQSRITSSPTIIIDDYLYGGGRSLKSLKQYICYTAGGEETRPAACRGTQPPPEIAATLLYDERCDDAAMCDVEGELAVLEKLIPGLKLVRLEFSSKEGRALYDTIQKSEAGVKELPVMIMGEVTAHNEELRNLLGEYLRPFGKGYLFALGGGWDPTAEICENSVDDNGDGKADCDDETCKEKLVCREEVKGRLDLFMMSGCPFALEMLPSVDRLLGHFGKNRKALDFHLQFIGKIEGGELMSMHGEREVAEDLRMICAEELYGKDYKFMEYVLCRAKDSQSPAWEPCLPKGMKAKKIRACAEGKRGKALLTKSFELADALGIRGSPTWILNNRLPMDGRTLEPLVEAFCKQNDDPECDKPPTPEARAPSVSGETEGQCQ
jgi:hypothetical protein